MNFLEDQNILYSRQFRFQNFFSKSHAMISGIGNIQGKVDDQ